MKRILSLLLCALLLAPALALPAHGEGLDVAAEETSEEELLRIAARVKELLRVEDDYGEFRGDYNDGLRPGWNLNWSGNDRELSVTCDREGVVTEYYRWDNGGKTDFYGFDAAFPGIPEERARSEAEEWLERLMGEGETARIDGRTAELVQNGEYRFYGRILKNGLESPVSFSLRIGAEGLRGYSRSDSYQGYVGELPEAGGEIPAEDAAAALDESVRMELYYVPQGDGEARLRYVPVGPYTVVDAMTGEAVDMDALYASFGGSAKNAGNRLLEDAAAAEEAAGMGAGLTEMELASIANYRDVLERETLDETLRALPDMGLEDFTLDRCSYTMDEGGQIRASLRYSALMDDDHLFGFRQETYDNYMSWSDRAAVVKYAVLDARTGALLELNTVYPLWEEGWKAGGDEEICGAFLAAAAPERYGESGRCDLTGKSQGDGVTFARLHEGYFYPDNYLYVGLNPGTGTVDEFRSQWDEDVRFADGEELVTEEKARKAYTEALEVTLGYTAWPEGIDYGDPIALRYADWGYTFVESLRLCWYYSGTDTVSGVDALTGEAVTEMTGGSFAYDDLAEEPRRDAIEALGAVGIGFAGGYFRPEEALTQESAALLLLRANGQDPSAWDGETLARQAVWHGFVPAGEWEPDRTVTRMEFVRMILAPSRYGAAAELEGVWAPAFEDVAPADEGYGALAGALGLAAGDTLEPDDVCTRGDAAEMLYGFMSR